MQTPENSFWTQAIHHGRVCGGCGGVMPADGRGSDLLVFLSLTGESFPHRLCESCLALTDTAAWPQLYQNVRLLVTTEGRA